MELLLHSAGDADRPRPPRRGGVVGFFGGVHLGATEKFWARARQGFGLGDSEAARLIGVLLPQRTPWCFPS